MITTLTGVFPILAAGDPTCTLVRDCESTSGKDSEDELFQEHIRLCVRGGSVSVSFAEFVVALSQFFYSGLVRTSSSSGSNAHIYFFGNLNVINSATTCEVPPPPTSYSPEGDSLRNHAVKHTPHYPLIRLPLSPLRYYSSGNILPAIGDHRSLRCISSESLCAEMLAIYIVHTTTIQFTKLHPVTRCFLIDLGPISTDGIVRSDTGTHYVFHRLYP